MSKMTLVPYKLGGYVEILSDDLTLDHKNVELNYIRLFFLFARKLVEHESFRKYTLELDNKIVALCHFAEQIRKQTKKVNGLKRPELKHVISFTEHQILLANVEGYLNCVHSIRDFLKYIDQKIDKKYFKSIYSFEWFQIAIDLRNVMHHCESAMLTVDNDLQVFSFKSLPKHILYSDWEKSKRPNGFHEVQLYVENMEHDMLNFLESWAKKHINEISEDAEMDIIIGFHDDGRLISEKRPLKYWLKQLGA